MARLEFANGKAFGQRLQRLKSIIVLLTQGSRSGDPGLELANAFGVGLRCIAGR